MKSIFKSITQKTKSLTTLYNKNTIHIARTTCVVSFIIGSGKLLIGISSLSFFACANALYTYGIVLSKFCAIRGISLANNLKEQCQYYKYSGVILIIASLAYFIYSIKLIINPVETFYDLYQGITIAFITFVEIGLNIRGMIIERNNHNIMYHALRAISFASSLISLVLTQTAILSFTSKTEGYTHDYSSNGYLGLIMALLATLVGIFIIYRGGVIEKGKRH